MDLSSDMGGDLAASKRLVFAGVVGLAALKLVSVCFHNYQLYEVDRLVNHIAHNAATEKRRQEAQSQQREQQQHPERSITPAPPASPSGDCAATSYSPSPVPSPSPRLVGDEQPLEAIDACEPPPWAAPTQSVVPCLSTNNTASSSSRVAAEKDADDGVEESACSHGVSSTAMRPHVTAADVSSTPASAHTAAALTTAVEMHDASAHSSTTSSAFPSTVRNNSGIFITAVHLVGGEPAPSTSQLILRLSMAGARSVSLASPEAHGAVGAGEREAEEADTPSVLATRMHSEASLAAVHDAGSVATAHSFSVVNVVVGGASAAHPDSSTSPREVHEESTGCAASHVVCEVTALQESHEHDAVALPPAPPLPIIFYDGAAPESLSVVAEAAVLEEGEEGGEEVGVMAVAPEHASVGPPPRLGDDASLTAAAAEEKRAQEEAAEADANRKEEEEEEEEQSPLPYFSFTTTSVHIAKEDIAEGSNWNVHSVSHSAASTSASAANSAAQSPYVSTTHRVPRGSVYVPSMAAAAVEEETAAAPTPASAPVAESEIHRSVSAASIVSSLSSSLGAARPMVHLFIQPRWALAPSLSPTCTKWETFLRLHHISYTVHEVHVLRVDQPQAQSTDLPQQIQHVVEASRSDESSPVVCEARAFAKVLTETTQREKACTRARAALRRFVPSGLLPGGAQTQYALPFLMVGGTILQGSFTDVMEALTRLGLVRPTTPPSAQASTHKTAEEGELVVPSLPPSSPYTPDEQRAIGQAVERTAEYTLRLLYEVGLVLEGSAVFSHYAAQLWSGHRYWDVFQLRRWCVYAWLAVPFLSALKADVERGLQAHEVGGLTREQLYKSLHSDLVSLEQLLVASAEAVPSSTARAKSDTTDALAVGTAAAAAALEAREREEGRDLEVRFLLGSEPGPQDCALYAYLLPILRLSPRDVARIRNPNFTYIYNSRIFRSFVAHMTRVAYPDLDVLLQPPRRPGFVSMLSSVAWDYVEKHTTPSLAAARTHLDAWAMTFGAALVPYRAALNTGLHRALRSWPASQLRCSARHLTDVCLRLVPARPLPSQTVASPLLARRDCTRVWWRFLDFSHTGRVTEPLVGAKATAVEPAATTRNAGESCEGSHRSSSSTSSRREESSSTRGRTLTEQAALDDTMPPLQPERESTEANSRQLSDVLSEAVEDAPPQDAEAQHEGDDVKGCSDIVSSERSAEEARERESVPLLPLPPSTAGDAAACLVPSPPLSPHGSEEAVSQPETVTAVRESATSTTPAAAAPEEEKEEADSGTAPHLVAGPKVLEVEKESAATSGPFIVPISPSLNAIAESDVCAATEDAVAPTQVEHEEVEKREDESDDRDGGSAVEQAVKEAASAEEQETSVQLPSLAQAMIQQDDQEKEEEETIVTTTTTTAAAAAALPPPPARLLPAVIIPRLNVEKALQDKLERSTQRSRELCSPPSEAAQPPAVVASPRLLTSPPTLPSPSSSPSLLSSSSSRSQLRHPPGLPAATPVAPGAGGAALAPASASRSGGSQSHSGSPLRGSRSGSTSTSPSASVLRSAHAAAVTPATPTPSTRQSGRTAGMLAAAPSAPSPRAMDPAATAASPGEPAGLRFTVDRVSAARTISRGLPATVEPGHAPTDAARRPTAAAAATRGEAGTVPAARPSAAPSRGSAEAASSATGPVLAVPRRIVARREAAVASPASLQAAAAGAARSSSLSSSGSDDGFEVRSEAGEGEGGRSVISEQRVSITPAGAVPAAPASVSRSSARTPTRERRPSGLSPGLFTTVVNRKVVLTDGREHPSWRVEPQRRTSSAPGGTAAAARSSSPATAAAAAGTGTGMRSRRSSLGGSSAVEASVRSPTTRSPARAVTPIRKTRPSPAGRPVV